MLPEVPLRGNSIRTVKNRSEFVLTIDKNGDQKHEEYVPSNQKGKLIMFFTIEKGYTI